MAATERKFGDWLNKKYGYWLAERGRNGSTMADFADYLGISSPLLSQYLHNKRRPTKRSIYRLASVLGSEVFQAAGIEVPEPDLMDVVKRWDKLSEETKTKIVMMANSDESKD